MTKLMITGASGFIGTAVVRRAVAAGYEVSGLTRSTRTADRLEKLGVHPVIGDLAHEGPWQEIVAGSELIVHLAQPETYGARVTSTRARQYGRARLEMDARLLNSVDPQVVRRIVFVCGTSYYGDQGEELRTEDATPHPKGWGPHLAPSIQALSEFVARGLPIVEAYPGWVYGPGSWFAEYQLEPLLKGRRVMRLAGPSQTVSAVEVEDCARALLHLLEHGQPGQRYFIVDDTPVHPTDIVAAAAKAMGIRGRTLPLPQLLCRLAMGSVITDSMTCNFRLSNQRLKSLGFTFDYPSIETGVPHAVEGWLALKKAQAT